MAHYAIPARTGNSRQDRTNRRAADLAFRKACDQESRAVKSAQTFTELPVHTCIGGRGKLTPARFRARYAGECDGCKIEAEARQ